MSLNPTVNTFRRKPISFIPQLDKTKVGKADKDAKKDARQFGKDLKNISTSSSTSLKASTNYQSNLSKTGINITNREENKKKDEITKCTKPKNTPEIIVMPRNSSMINRNSSACITSNKTGEQTKKEFVKSYQKEGELTTMDKLYQGNMLYVTEYVSDIFYHAIASENKTVAFPNYLLKQDEINETHRLKLVEWIIEIHNYLKLLPETLYLTVNLIDRYLTAVEVKSTMLQLIGVSAMFIASKYEEIYAPELRDFEFVTKEKCSKKSILSMEYDILKKLQFNVLIVSPLLIFNRLFFITANSKEELKSHEMNQIYHLSNFIMELCLLEYTMLKYSPSIIAASALFVSRKVFKLKPSWPQNISSIASICSDTVFECSKEILSLIKKEKKSTINILKDKYSRPLCLNVYSILGGTTDSGKSGKAVLKTADSSNRQRSMSNQRFSYRGF